MVSDRCPVSFRPIFAVSSDITIVFKRNQSLYWPFLRRSFFVPCVSSFPALFLFGLEPVEVGRDNYDYVVSMGELTAREGKREKKAADQKYILLNESNFASVTRETSPLAISLQSTVTLAIESHSNVDIDDDTHMRILGSSLRDPLLGRVVVAFNFQRMM